MGLLRLWGWKTWTFDLWVAWLSFTYLVTLAALMRPQSDTWWLLQTGKIILEQKIIPLTDSFSSTASGNYWPNHEWLSQVFMYGAYSFGGMGSLISLFVVIILVAWVLLYRICEGAMRCRAVILVLGTLVNCPGWTLRPQVMSLALFVLLLNLIFTRRWWWCPPVFLVWANLHAGFAAGLILLGCAVLAYGSIDRRDGKKLFLIGCISSILTLANPLGWRLWQYAFNSANDETRLLIAEWRRASFLDPQSYPFIILWSIALWTSWRLRFTWRGSRDRTLLIAMAVFGLLAWKVRRHSIFFDVLAIPIVSRWVAQTEVKPIGSRMRGGFHQVTAACLGITAVYLSVLAIRGWRPPLSPHIVHAVSTCRPSLFNPYNIGGELIWFVPSQKVFIDNRQDPYTHALFKVAAKVEETGDYADVFDQYGIGCAFIPEQSPLNDRLRTDGWHLKASEDGHAVWERSD